MVHTEFVVDGLGHGLAQHGVRVAALQTAVGRSRTGRGAGTGLRRRRRLLTGYFTSTSTIMLLLVLLGRFVVLLLLLMKLLLVLLLLLLLMLLMGLPRSGQYVIVATAA